MIGYEEAPRYPALISALTGDREITPPGITLEADRPEYSFLKRERLFTTGPQFVAANVAGVGQVEVNYPLALAQATGFPPRMIAVITGIKICGVNTVAGDRYQLTHQGALAGAPAPGFLRDTRTDPGAATSRSMIRTAILNTNGAVSGDILDEESCSVTGQDLFFDVVPLILHQGLPNASLERYTVFTVAVNKALRCIFWGYERVARPEEIAEG